VGRVILVDTSPGVQEIQEKEAEQRRQVVRRARLSSGRSLLPAVCFGPHEDDRRDEHHHGDADDPSVGVADRPAAPASVLGPVSSR